MRPSLCMLKSGAGQIFKSLEIPVLEPGQVENDRAITTSNRLFRFSRPDCVVQPETAKHVQAIVREAASKNIDLTIKCNGHSMQLKRQWSQQMVTVTVKETDDRNSKEGKLFWALQGAGGGNFGVVVQMKLKVQRLQNLEGTVVAGRYQWFPEEGFSDEVNTTMNDFYTTNWPNSTTIDSTWVCDLRQNKRLDGIRFNVSFEGSRLKYERVINKHIQHEKLKTQLMRRALPEKSTRFLYETLNDDKEKIAKVTGTIGELMKEFRKDFTGEEVNFLVTWIHSGGKATEKNPADLAFFWREAVFHTDVTVKWMGKWMEKDMRFFLAKVKTALRPPILNGEAAFVNFPDRDFPTKFHEKAYFGDNREELRLVKEMWDKNKLFRFAQGVRLPGDPEEDPDEEKDKTDRLANEQWESDRAQWKPYKTGNFENGLYYLEDLGF
ncbi:hypothetical protein ACSS6W_008949 [Trichoderma asperelloides]